MAEYLLHLAAVLVYGNIAFIAARLLARAVRSIRVRAKNLLGSRGARWN